ncbi:MAG: hypothetical protein Kow0069_12390 [Promethearchaeota archaeon]
MTIRGTSPREVFRKGAEATLFVVRWRGRKALLKARLPKSYRHPRLDRSIRASRTAREARALVNAKRLGVPTPQVFDVDLEDAELLTSFVEGPTLRDVVDGWKAARVETCFRGLGATVAKLHGAGMVHGDLTTSNVIVRRAGGVALVDFGLSTNTSSDEDRAVELHLLKRVLCSTHQRVWKVAYRAFLGGYAERMDAAVEELDRRVTGVESRGRYVDRTRRQLGDYPG